MLRLCGRTVRRFLSQKPDGKLLQKASSTQIVPSTAEDIAQAKEDRYEEISTSLKQTLDGNLSLDEALTALEKPIEIRVHGDDVRLMNDPLKDESKYLPLDGTAKEQGLLSAGSAEMIRVAGNELARDVLSSGKLNISDPRVNVTSLNLTEMSMISSGKI